MAQIFVVNDPNIEQTPIVHALNSTGGNETGGEEFNPSAKQQTKVFGVLVPIIALNTIAVDWGDVLEFGLDGTTAVPSVNFEFRDRHGFLKQYNQPGNDNELRVQILPPTDNTYKKIDLTFLVTKITIDNGICKGTAEYKVPKFTDSQFKALGQLTTYELFNKVSIDTGLGFACNIEATEDKRYMTCRYESYKDLIEKEMPKSGSSEVHVFDWWVDFWNNLVLCDLYDRVNSEDPEEDMMIWVTLNPDAAAITDEPESVQQLATFTNNPAMDGSDLRVVDFEIDNLPTNSYQGNEIALSVYEENKKEYVDHYIADGDIKKNKFTKFEYAGEVYGDYNYLLAEKCREIFLRKVKSEVVVIHTKHPQLGIMRGSQCRFIWYDNDSMKQWQRKNLEEAGAIVSEETAIQQIGWLKDWQIEYNDLRPMVLNLQVSGQYTCVGQYISYSDHEWDCWLYLIRPASKRPELMIEPEQNQSNI